MSIAIYTRQKNQMLSGAKQMLAHSPSPDLAADINELIGLIEKLPIELEAYSPDQDKPVSDYFVQKVNWRQSITAQLTGIVGVFSVGATRVFTKASGLVNDIAADGDLLAIAEKLVVILDKAFAVVADQNVTTFAGQYYRMKLEKGD